MTDLRTEHARRESESWTAFETALERIPRERWDGSEVVPGWTVKELLWHMAGWLDKCSGNLERFGRGEGEAPTDRTVDERNDELAAEARAMTVDAVHEGLLSARARVRRRWEALPAVDRRAIEELADETYEHYDEHREDLQRLAG
jgi:uncharacterized damage-inducible protein DinB